MNIEQMLNRHTHKKHRILEITLTMDNSEIEGSHHILLALTLEFFMLYCKWNKIV